MRLKRAKLLGNLINGIQVVIGDGEEAERLHELAEAEARRLLRRRRARLRARHSARSARACRRRARSTAPATRSPRRGRACSAAPARIETDFLNGEIVLLGRLHGVPTPVNAAIQTAREPDRPRASRARIARTTRLSGVGGCAGARPWPSRGGRRGAGSDPRGRAARRRPARACSGGAGSTGRPSCRPSSRPPATGARRRRGPRTSPSGPTGRGPARPARRPISAVTAASISGCPAWASSAASSHRPATLTRSASKPGSVSRTLASRAAATRRSPPARPKRGRASVVQALVGGVGVDVAEFSRQGEHQVGDRRAATGRQACEAVHFRPTLSGFIR